MLADYLPPEEDPDYDMYWSKLPDFRNQLEERYPEPCGSCALRASNKIKQANYAAKVAMIGNLLERSHNMKPTYAAGATTPRRLKLAWWVARGVAWVGMHAIVVAWHASAILYPTVMPSLLDLPGTTAECVRSLGDPIVYNACRLSLLVETHKMASSILGKVMPWGAILCLFWNYQALAQTRHPNAKLVGLELFMKCEAVSFLARLLAWWFVLGLDPEEKNVKAVNLGFLVFSVVVSFATYGGKLEVVVHCSLICFTRLTQFIQAFACKTA